MDDGGSRRISSAQDISQQLTNSRVPDLEAHVVQPGHCLDFEEFVGACSERSVPVFVCRVGPPEPKLRTATSPPHKTKTKDGYVPACTKETEGGYATAATDVR